MISTNHDKIVSAYRLNRTATHKHKFLPYDWLEKDPEDQTIKMFSHTHSETESKKKERKTLILPLVRERQNSILEVESLQEIKSLMY